MLESLRTKPENLESFVFATIRQGEAAANPCETYSSFLTIATFRLFLSSTSQSSMSPTVSPICLAISSGIVARTELELLLALATADL